MRTSAFARHALDRGLTQNDVDEIAEAWRAWSTSPGAWLVTVPSELIVRKP